MAILHDPVVVAGDFCACIFAARLRDLENTQSSPIDSGTRQSLARLRWSLHVSLPCRTGPLVSGIKPCLNLRLQLGIRHYSSL
jgi:hypothetical protein